MALETLQGFCSFGGLSVIREKPPNMSWDEFDDLRAKIPIHISEKNNMISFRLQKGPIKEVGVNGCQVDTLILVAQEILNGFNCQNYNTFNVGAIQALDIALKFLEMRRMERESRGVEGTSSP